MNGAWEDGNNVRLLINGEDYYERVFAGIRLARREVLLETFIIFDDKVGRALQQALIEAARRGVRVEVAVDGYGTADLPEAFIHAMTAEGVRVHIFDPRPRLIGLRTNLFRRLHRKIVVIDGRRAFIGGLNYSADHLMDSGPMAKQDYAVEVTGPVIRQVHDSSRRLLATVSDPPSRIPSTPMPTGQARAMLLERDNLHHTHDIEAHYLAAFQVAHTRLVVANAYFFPGYRLLRALRNAARRGVDVTLILQGQPDMRWVSAFSRLLYNYLLRDGVKIFEYCQRPLHGKVALMDDEWATVGSSNLDPLSLALNLEANLFIRDAAFTENLHRHLSELAGQHCKRITLQRMIHGYWWRAPLIFLCFHCTRYFPTIAGWLPAHRQVLHPWAPNEQGNCIHKGNS
ncbi:cardiolipin synthase ClsB [Pseudomonas gingeri]|uniref:Cardiolipin synthase B n=1 Tax=Pseudomonas gingeri TaxID=117681 RepID=A0A7Y7YCM7_9PSED|nr:cardiolipin synthase ClsB [Pseudomonas gingeri]NWA12516.1 cardiolipin synthase ClsB [Pseudomonas gingeri]NWA57078.1 cardiolipin synthase ClsB [Pseudomonas gingeri]NWA93421.1 cardiolipin synthase ClsB [Pseudomonas gingeri]NWB02893.1 cardiolipin synthase ClsB [Pseudomonas gingeri]